MTEDNLTREVVALARAFEVQSGERVVHLDSFVGARRHSHDAQLIRRVLGPGKTVLDLGCGIGQMSYLLGRLGLDVTASDIHPQTPYYITKFNDQHEKRIVYRPCNILEGENHKLAGLRFDGVCLSGVVEHVPDFGLFLRHVKELLPPDGKLFIFRFPNRTSWIEAISDLRAGNAASHPLRFGIEEIDFMLPWHGFRVDKSAYEEILPINLRFPGVPRFVTRLYHWLRLLVPVSYALCRVPVLNRLATSFRFVCTRARTKS